MHLGSQKSKVSTNTKKKNTEKQDKINNKRYQLEFIKVSLADRCNLHCNFPLLS